MKSLSLGVMTFNEANVTYKGCALPKTLWRYFKTTAHFPDEQPDLFAVCTQESLVQHSFHEALLCALDGSYILIARNRLILPPGSSTVLRAGALLGKPPKNVRTSLYLRSALMDEKKLIGLLSVNKDAKWLESPKDLLLINGFELLVKIKNHSFRSGHTVSKMYKSAILFSITLRDPHSHSGNANTVQLVNTHLYFTPGGDQGLSERVHDFFDVVKEFRLDESYRNGENVVFCGDLNFRVNPTGKQCQNISPTAAKNQFSPECLVPKISFCKKKWDIEQCSQRILELYRLLHSSNDSARLAAKRELQEFIEIQQIFVDQKNDDMNAFLQGLQQSQYLQSPTCRLAKKKKATGLFAPRLDLNSFHIMSKKSGHEYTSRIPSTCDQILFATRSPAAFGLIGNMISFQSVSMTQSDHAALVAFFKVALP